MFCRTDSILRNILHIHSNLRKSNSYVYKLMLNFCGNYNHNTTNTCPQTKLHNKKQFHMFLVKRGRTLHQSIDRDSPTQHIEWKEAVI